MTIYGMTDQEARRLADSLPAKSYQLGLPYDMDWVTAKVYEPANSEGHEATVAVSRAPAQFWRVICPDLDLDLSTGSGMGGLATEIAASLANGMLGITGAD